MELKSNTEELINPRLRSSNCTFMELKLGNAISVVET